MLQINKFSFGGSGVFSGTLLRTENVTTGPGILGANASKTGSKVACYIRKNDTTYENGFGVYDYDTETWDWYKTFAAYNTANAQSYPCAFDTANNYIYFRGIAASAQIISKFQPDGTFVEDATFPSSNTNDGGDILETSGGNFHISTASAPSTYAGFWYFGGFTSALATTTDKQITFATASAPDYGTTVLYPLDSTKAWIWSNGGDLHLYDTTTWSVSTNLKSLSNYYPGAGGLLGWVVTLDGTGNPLFVKNSFSDYIFEKWDYTLTTNSFAKKLTFTDSDIDSLSSGDGPKFTRDCNYIYVTAKAGTTGKALYFFNKTTLDFVGGFKISNPNLTTFTIARADFYDLTRGTIVFSATESGTIYRYVLVIDKPTKAEFSVTNDWTIQPVSVPYWTSVTASTVNTPTNYSPALTDLTNMGATAQTYTSNTAPTVTKVI